MEIRTFGGGERIRECERLLDRLLAERSGRLILLPIPTSRDNKYITGTQVSSTEILSLIEGECAVVGYNIPAPIRLAALERGALVYDGALDEGFLSDNAELTARGAVGYILTHGKRDISELSIGVVGYGRIGMRLIRLLLLFGAKVTLYTTRRSVAMDMGEVGVSAYLVGEGCDFSGLDLLINTAPARQIEESDLPDKTEIIDLASGSIFEPSDRLTKLASIPDTYYPISAGRLYAEAALCALRGEGK